MVNQTKTFLGFDTNIYWVYFFIPIVFSWRTVLNQLIPDEIKITKKYKLKIRAILPERDH